MIYVYINIIYTYINNMNKPLKNNKKYYSNKGDERMDKRDFVTPERQLENMINLYYSQKPYLKTDKYKEKELEVRFGTRGKQMLTKMDYDNVIKKIKSLGFNSVSQEGSYLLRINTEYFNKNIGYTLSNIRTEITGLDAIQYYCKTNDINKLLSSTQPVYFIKLNKKYNASDNDDNKLKYVNFNDFNFRVSYQIEEDVSINSNIAKEIFDKWEQTKKSFRYINRVTFKHPNIPINIDISIVKSSSIDNKGNYLLYTNVQDSNVFNNIINYEIELEIVNKEIGPGTQYTTHTNVLNVLKKTIKYILTGIQKSNYPISYSEQDDIFENYMNLLFKEKFNEIPKNLKNKSRYFIGPSSYTLQIKNIIPHNENMKIPNIRRNYCVTDKADGERRMLYISSNGKIYLIDTGMNITYTGAITKESDTFNSLIDGELILHDKYGKFINLFAGFDIYFLNKKDVRSMEFIETYSRESDKKNKPTNDQFRYSLLIKLIKMLNPVSILENNISPIRIQYKNFYSTIDGDDKSIFQSCNIILTEVHNDNFEYKTDGLIFTPSNFGVGGNKVGITGDLKKETWEYSFKWKPPEFNTIDFLVTTLKDNNNLDITKSLFQDGINTASIEQLNQYKIVILRCGFDERKHGYINPCQDVIDDKLPKYNENKSEENENYKPVQFYPSNPYDPDAGICNIVLRKDDNGVFRMFSEENEIIEDNTIVEFKYDFNKPEGFKWLPLRVRYDKTSELKRGKRNFGNDYSVADSNWYSIHNPITLNMIVSGDNIPEETFDSDIYYNKITSDTNTRGLRDFHNLFVKKKLITSVSKPNQTLIDYACGKGGDFPKWIESKLSFVFGIDLSKDNLENRLNGACARFISFKKDFKDVPYALFVNGNSSLNIRNGTAMLNDKATQISNCIFGNTQNINKEILGNGVLRQVGVGKNGFNVSSCQFAIHYFFENVKTFYNFIRNVSECTALNGYFIGTSYDGKTIFERIKKLKINENYTIYDNSGDKVWQIIKKYDDNDIFKDDETCLGYKIGIYQESINNIIDEYLVNWDYLTRILEDYGFILLSNNEAERMGLPSSSGMFNILYDLMKNNVNNNNNLKLKFGDAINMKPYEKEISFLNRYFVYKKIREVDSEKITKNFINKTFSQAITEEKINSSIQIIRKPKKLNKKIIIIPGTEALEEEENIELKQEKIKIYEKKEEKEEKEEKEDKEDKREKGEKEENEEKIKKQDDKKKESLKPKPTPKPKQKDKNPQKKLIIHEE